MLRLAADENLHGDIVRGLIRREPRLDILRVQDVGLRTADDRSILEWTASQGRILLTHDQATMADFASERIIQGLSMPGIFLVHARMPVGQAIEEILFLATHSDPREWDGFPVYQPM